jgi:hypothetical protein
MDSQLMEGLALEFGRERAGMAVLCRGGSAPHQSDSVQFRLAGKAHWPSPAVSI